MDLVGLIVDAMRYAAEKHGLTVTDEATKSIIGIVQGCVSMLFPNDSDKYDELLATLLRILCQTLRQTTNCLLVSKKLIQDLRAKAKH